VIVTGRAPSASSGTLSCALVVGLALAVTLTLALPATAGARGPAHVKGSVRLSNERTLTRWAHPVEIAPIRRMPRMQAPSITPIHYSTEDGFPEVYLVLRRWIDRSGSTWYQVRIPMRPNGRTGWVRERALGPLYRVRTHLVVDSSKLRATLHENGRKIWSAPVGIGKSSTPTPTGRFWIREKFRTSDSSGPYGPAAFGTSDYSVLTDWPGGGVIGIHGTDAPSLIPGRPSHGCIRLRNADVKRLWRLMPIGTPLLIRR
jgi:hypothetical protein